MVDLPKKLVSFVSICALAISLMMLCLPTVAIADTQSCLKETEKAAVIHKGSFDFTRYCCVNSQKNFRSVVVSLPDGETGIINSLVIIGSDKQKEFGCQNIQIQNGTDLIKQCGGPVVLKEGLTRYHAQGSGFNPNLDLLFSVHLNTEFSS